MRPTVFSKAKSFVDKQIRNSRINAYNDLLANANRCKAEADAINEQHITSTFADIRYRELRGKQSYYETLANAMKKKIDE